MTKSYNIEEFTEKRIKELMKLYTEKSGGIKYYASNIITLAITELYKKEEKEIIKMIEEGKIKNL